MSSTYDFTVVLSTFNEEARVEAALRNFHGRAHLMVVDNFSTDKTVEIAKRYTDQIVFRTNPGWGSPDCYRFRMDLAPTNYMLFALAGQIHPPALVDLYAEVAREGRFKAVATYNIVCSYGVEVTTYTRPYSNPDGGFKFCDKRAIDLSRSVIHSELPFTGDKRDILYPPRRREYCIFSFRDDNSNSTELKHARYANEDARARFAKGARAGLGSFAFAFCRHLFGCLLWRGAILQGMPGLINSLWRANYFLSVEIRIWELQNGLTPDAIKAAHAKLKEGILERHDGT